MTSTGPDPLPPSAPPPPEGPAEPRRFNGVGLAALIVGAVALVLAFVPLASFVAFLPALAAIVLGIIGLVLRGRRRATAATGLVLGAVALIVAIVLSVIAAIGFVSRTAAGIEDLRSSFPTEFPSEGTVTPEPGQPTASPSPGISLEPGEHTVEFTIEGSGTATVTYSAYAGGDARSSAGKQRPLPFRQTIRVETTEQSRFASFTVGATQSDPGEPVRCTVTVDGTVVSTQESDRKTLATVFCSVRSGF